MSEPQQQTAAAPEGGFPGAGPGCPLSPEILAPNMRKHVDPKAPVPIRMMAAKTMVPLSPSDMVTALYILTYDPDPAVREAVAKTVPTLPDRILGTALRDAQVKGPILGFLLDTFWEKDQYAE